MVKLDVFDWFSQSIQLFFKLYIPKLSEKCTEPLSDMLDFFFYTQISPVISY